MANRPITPTERAQWSALGHLLVLEAIGSETEWTEDDFAFQGGTSLHLSWNSPRFSEDLDFLLDYRKAERLEKVMAGVAQRVQQRMALIDPEMQIRLVNKSREQLGDYRLWFSKPGVLGNVMIKSEFWKVDPTYLEAYQSTMRMPAIPVDLGGYNLHVNAMVPAATLQAAYLDKLTAFATRPFLKWRDIFDIWWVTNNPTFSPVKKDELAPRLLQNVSAYKTLDGLPVPEALRASLTRDSREAILAKAENDLKPFLSPAMWAKLWPDTVGQMLDCAMNGVNAAADQVELYLQQEPGDDEAHAEGERP